MPGLYTFLGGPIIIVGCLLVTLSAHKRATIATATTMATMTTPPHIHDNTLDNYVKLKELNNYNNNNDDDDNGNNDSNNSYNNTNDNETFTIGITHVHKND